MLILVEGEIEGSVVRLIDSLIPVISSIVWIIAIRLVNKVLPGKKNDDDGDDLDDDEKRPNLPMK